MEKRDVHTSRTTRDLPTLLHTLQLSPTLRLALTLHIIIVERRTPVPDEIRCARQRRGRRSDLVHLGDIRGHGGRVHQDTLVEAMRVEL